MTASTFWRFSKVRRVRNRRQTLPTALIGVMLWLPAKGFAAPDAVQIHGFASQGLISTSKNNFFGPSENGASSEFTELGANLSYRATPDLLLSAQLVSRRAGETDNGNVRLDYGFADYTFVSTDSARWGVLAGKVKNPFGFYNTTRDVAFTRPSILLPQSIYFDRARNFALSAPGISLYGDRLSDNGDISFQFGVARPEVGDRGTEFAFLSNDWPGKLEGRTSYIGRILFEDQGGRTRIALSGAQINMDYRPGSADMLSGGSVKFTPWVLSAQYNAERWTATSEYGVERGNLRGFGLPGLERDGTSEHFYLQGTYRFSSAWEGIIRYDVLHLSRDDRDGTRFAADNEKPAHLRFAKDWTIGARYDVTPSMMLRAEYHSIDGTAWLPFEDNPATAATSRRWDMFLLQASYKF